MSLCKHMQKPKEGRIEEFEQSPRGELQRTTSLQLPANEKCKLAHVKETKSWTGATALTVLTPHGDAPMEGRKC